MTKLVDDVVMVIEGYDELGVEQQARAAIAVFAAWLREPSEEMLIGLADEADLVGAAHALRVLRALASHLEEQK